MDGSSGDRIGTAGTGTELHHLQWICRNVHHCTETGLEVQRGRVSGRFPWIRRIILVATMAGITEVNPLSPHYLCGECYYVDFDSDEVKTYSGRAGCDMPDKICPR